MRSMGGNFIHTNMSFLNTDDQLPCSEEFGNLPSVNKQEARWRLKSMMSRVSLSFCLCPLFMKIWIGVFHLELSLVHHTI